VAPASTYRYGVINNESYFSDFEEDNGGFVASGVTSWEWAGTSLTQSWPRQRLCRWATNLTGDYKTMKMGTSISNIDLSGYLDRPIENVMMIGTNGSI